jgi:hypothetical protein
MKPRQDRQDKGRKWKGEKVALLESQDGEESTRDYYHSREMFHGQNETRFEDSGTSSVRWGLNISEDGHAHPERLETLLTVERGKISQGTGN